MRSIALLVGCIAAAFCVAGVDNSGTDTRITITDIVDSYTPSAAPKKPAAPKKYRQCVDLRDDCADLVADCTLGPRKKWMHPHCPVTCGVCHNRTVTVPQKFSFSPAVLRVFNPILDAVGASIGVPQVVSGNAFTKSVIVNKVQESIHYYTTVVMVQDRYESVRDLCKNQHSRCAQYAVTEDRCNDDDFQEEMLTECAVTCMRCEQLSEVAKCPYDPSTMPNAWYPGDANRMFERIVSSYSDAYNITVLSRPSTVKDEDGPWVLAIDNFASDEECNRLIEIGHEAGYERSMLHDEVISYERTSSNTWCDIDECKEDASALAIRHRIADLTGISPTHSELMQLLKYNPGEFYKVRRIDVLLLL